MFLSDCLTLADGLFMSVYVCLSVCMFVSGELKIWLKARAPQELMQAHPSVPFLYFDVGGWEARLFTVNFRGNLAAGLLSDEEVRVKALPQTAMVGGGGGSSGSMSILGNN